MFVGVDAEVHLMIATKTYSSTNLGVRSTGQRRDNPAGTRANIPRRSELKSF